MAHKKRKVLLLLDNVSSHKFSANVELKAVQVAYFPPNCTAKIQPMDQGAILATKCSYRKRIVRKLIDCMDHGEDLQIDILTAITNLAGAWEGVKEDVLESAFRRSGIIQRDVVQTDNDEGIEWWDPRFSPEITFSDYVAADSDVSITFGFSWI